MSEFLRIGELAAAAAVPTSTIRFYERAGLLSADQRTRSSYRLYGPAAVERLRFIRLAQSSGFTLEDVAALLELQGARGVPRETVRPMLTRRLEDVRRRQLELAELETALRRSLEACSRQGKGRAAGAGGGCCPVVKRLTVSASRPAKKIAKRA